MRYTTLESIATGNPPITGSQDDAVAFMQRVTSLPETIRRRLPIIYDRSGIDRRYSCVPDYESSDPADFQFFAPNDSLHPTPSTGTRNAWYRKAVLPLAEQVARDAVQQAGLQPRDITHLIAVTCTGFFAPGLDIELVKRLGLPPTTQRTLIGFMGCYAAFNALRVAHGFCQTHADARVLIVCAELCSLHFQIDDSFESAVVNALFSDGAAAVVLASRAEAEAAGKLAYAASHTLLDDDSMEDMTWDVGDTGFLMGLSSRVPDIIAQALPAYLEALLCPHDLTPEAVGFWAIHPGGRSIVEKARDVIGLSDAQVHDSLEVMRLYGNMSSPTILFVLKRFLEKHRTQRANGEPGLTSGVALAFGPGLTLEGCLWQQVGSVG